jgi:hypothetical protein
MEPDARIELATFGLQNRYSTAELIRHEVWLQMGSNHRPIAYQAIALTN